MAVAPIRKTVANRVCAKSSFVSHCQICSTSKNWFRPKPYSLRNSPHPKLRPQFCIGCRFACDGGIALPDASRQNPVCRASLAQPGKPSLDSVNILARPIYTKPFQLCCIKHVTGLFVSRHFNNSVNSLVLRLTPFRQIGYTTSHRCIGAGQAVPIL